MKRTIILFWILTLSGFVGVNAQHAAGLYPAGVQAVLTPLPFECVKCTPYLAPVVNFAWEKGKQLPLFSYRDLNGTEKNTNEERFAYIFRHFELPSSDCDLLVIAIEKSYYTRHLLVSCKNGKLVDWIEGGISSNDDIAVKQWRIGADETIQVSSLHLINKVPVKFDDTFVSIDAQREDAFYEVDKDGKFKRVEVRVFDAKAYSKADLQDKEKNIWDE